MGIGPTNTSFSRPACSSHFLYCYSFRGSGQAISQWTTQWGIHISAVAGSRKVYCYVFVIKLLSLRMYYFLGFLKNSQSSSNDEVLSAFLDSSSWKISRLRWSIRINHESGQRSGHSMYRAVPLSPSIFLDRFGRYPPLSTFVSGKTTTNLLAKKISNLFACD